MPSICCMVRHLIGLSLLTHTPMPSTATRKAVGLDPYFFSKASISPACIVRLIGPSCEVPWISAGGAVEEPLPSIWMRMFGYSRLSPPAHSVIRLFRVSEPTELRLPETPLVLL